LGGFGNGISDLTNAIYIYIYIYIYTVKYLFDVSGFTSNINQASVNASFNVGGYTSTLSNTIFNIRVIFAHL
jgi:hypothetical protein